MTVKELMDQLKELTKDKDGNVTDNSNVVIVLNEAEQRRVDLISARAADAGGPQSEYENVELYLDMGAPQP